MPIYEYQCGNCNHQLEAFQKMSEEPLTECPVCHQQTLNKLVSASGFHLKGTGWYATDYRNKNSSAPSSKNESTKDETTTSTEGNSSQTKDESTDTQSTSSGSSSNPSTNNSTREAS